MTISIILMGLFATFLTLNALSFVLDRSEHKVAWITTAVNLYTLMALVSVVMYALGMTDVNVPKGPYEITAFILCSSVMLWRISCVNFREYSIVLTVIYRIIMLSTIVAHMLFVFPVFNAFLP